ncbi:DUF1104 domain-containing protein [Helicobacter sp. 13S00477-4]|uniref:DUF1104 domain-containing protein n=1 Tax=Helicobacter sp. 13S00477-4 TaxID=1905759 RepID=UPI000BA679CB|nr:DUF1104 domain-containing protein [Helicobacter sp. 13S00477-4]PAF49734.1 hypothetical protein BKH44_08620 [Helicobacter sp. 13S00477-4]
MNKLAYIVLAGILSTSVAFGADFSKKTNDELVKMAGTIAPKDAPDYRIELHKRFKTMKKPEAKKFHEALEQAMEKNTETMTLKEFRERKEAIKKAMDERRKTMTKQQIKDSGLARMTHKCHPHDHPKEHDKKPAPKK